jgi:hypothetical protein
MRVASQMQTRFLYWCVRVEGFQLSPQICVLGVRCRRVSFIGACVLKAFNDACWESDADAFPLLVRAC